MAYDHARRRRPADSKYKFERTIIFLIALRGTVELEGSPRGGTGCLRVIFGEHSGLSAGELVIAYDADIKAGSAWRMAKQGGAEGPKEEKGLGSELPLRTGWRRPNWRWGAGRWDDRENDRRRWGTPPVGR